MAFDHDIFISYAREDDLPPPSGGDGWVSRFHKDLEFRLRRRFGKPHPPRIWRDELNLSANQPMWSEIRTRLERSMLFLALHSTNYASSDNCREEWTYFLKFAQSQPPGLYLAGNHCRFFHALLRNFDPASWPVEFRECAAFRFCDSDIPEHYGDPTEPDKDWQRFDSQMKRLVDAIEKVIFAQPELAGPREPGSTATVVSSQVPAGPLPDSNQPDRRDRPVVFLAHVADTLKSARKRLASELEKRMIAVLPPYPPPFDPEPEHRSKLGESLRRAALAVHMLDRYAGGEIGGSPERTYSQVQAEAVLATAVPQLIWMPERSEIDAADSPDHRRLLERLEQHPRVHKPYRFLCGHRDDLTRMVLDALQNLRPPAPPPPADFEVLIDAENQDRRHGALLMAYLEDQRVPCLLHQERPQAHQRVDEFDENLRLVRALVILFGQADAALVHQRLQRSARRSAGTAEARLRHFSIFLPAGSRGDPEELEQEWGRRLNLQILDNRHSDQIDPRAVRPLLDAIRSS